MIAPRSSRLGYPHNTPGLRPGSTSSSTIVRSPWCASLSSLPRPLPLILLFCNRRAVRQRAKNYSISSSRPMSASVYTKSRCGVCMRCRTTCYRRAIRSWRRTARQSPLVRTFSRLVAMIWLRQGTVGIKRTKLRLVRCRARMEMPTRERLRDARADKNLDDVARIPAPWDAEALEQFHRTTTSP